MTRGSSGTATHMGGGLQPARGFSPAPWGSPPGILLLLAILCAAALSAQTPAPTLDQAEALWKQHRYVESNDVFRALVENDVSDAFVLLVDPACDALVPCVDGAGRFVGKAVAVFIDENPVGKHEHGRL